MDRLELLKALSFGSQVAEEEVNALADYFVETDLWSRIINGEVDIIRGEKGTGKSAIYLLLEANRDDLFDQNVLLASAENPRGATAFKDLIPDPPATEQEFIVLWKMYLVVLIAYELRSFGISGEKIDSVYAILEEANLLEKKLNLSRILRSVQGLARRLLSVKAIEAGVDVDSLTGMPTRVVGKISLEEPTSELSKKGISSIDGLYSICNDVLSASNVRIWVLLDRLDVAFAENHELEANALRALFRVYGDLRNFDNISLKIFLREDIWSRITADGFREASHLIRCESVSWTTETLLNLLIRRVLNNPDLVNEYEIDKDSVLDDSGEQNALFDHLFPEKVEQGPRNPTTLKWIITRCADGTGKTAPRELIHLMICLRSAEIRRLELGGKPAAGKQLFDRTVFKQALPTVSETRLNTYLYAEYPEFKPLLEKLRSQKTEQTPESLMQIWGMDRAEAISKAVDLVTLGFFEQHGSQQEPTFWVPFLYRDSLSLVQGKAEVGAN